MRGGEYMGNLYKIRFIWVLYIKKDKLERKEVFIKYDWLRKGKVDLRNEKVVWWMV